MGGIDSTGDGLAVIFDLDGTLTDSKPGVVRCLSEALEASGVPWQAPLDWFIGPPIEQSMLRLMPDSNEAERRTMVAHYRACYDKEGWAENTVYAGIPELLTSLIELGARLYVCTSKSETFALRILQKFELSQHFIAVYADRGETPHSKVDLLATLLRDQHLDASQCFMIGDREYDMEAATANGIRPIAVTYGYGSVEELTAGYPLALCATPREILTAITGANQNSRRNRGEPAATGRR